MLTLITKITQGVLVLSVINILWLPFYRLTNLGEILPSKTIAMLYTCGLSNVRPNECITRDFTLRNQEHISLHLASS